MSEFDLVVLQSDAEIERLLVSALSNLSKRVHATRCMEQVRNQIVQSRANTVILDMEAVSIAEIEGFVRDFPSVTLVCNHRLADEELWRTAMNAGAHDCCASCDTRGIVAAVRTSAARSLRAAA